MDDWAPVENVGTPVRRSYRDTFQKHRFLFCVPPVLAAIIAAAVMFTKGHTYQATASLWIDNPPPLGSSLNSSSTGSATPATEVQTLLSELLATRAFVFDVADGSQLTSYLRSHSKGSLRSAIMASVGSNTTSSTPGPQVLLVDYTGPTAVVAQSVLKRLIVDLQSASSKYGNIYVSSELSYYNSQRTAAESAVDSTQAEITRYRNSHPGATAASDPAYSALLAASQAASTQLSQAQTNKVQAAGALRVKANSPIVDVVDQPTLPSGSSSSKKKDVEAVAGGFVAGILLSLLAVILMTPGTPEREDRPPSGRVPRDSSQDGVDAFDPVVDDAALPAPPR